MATDLTGIRTYYDETWLDYRWLWLNPTNYAIHFGYWDESTHSHKEALNRLNAVLASFRTIELTDITSHMRRSLKRLHRMALVFSPEAVLRAVRLRTPAQHGNVRGAHDQFHALERGLWHYVMLTATAG
jgi:hypothetical protein